MPEFTLLKIHSKKTISEIYNCISEYGSIDDIIYTKTDYNKDNDNNFVPCNRIYAIISNDLLERLIENGFNKKDNNHSFFLEQLTKIDTPKENEKSHEFYIPYPEDMSYDEVVRQLNKKLSVLFKTYWLTNEQVKTMFYRYKNNYSNITISFDSSLSAKVMSDARRVLDQTYWEDENDEQIFCRVYFKKVYPKNKDQKE
jgi:hypothetical protein